MEDRYSLIKKRQALADGDRALNSDAPRVQRQDMPAEDQELTEREKEKLAEDKKNTTIVLIALLALVYIAFKILFLSKGKTQWFGPFEQGVILPVLCVGIFLYAIKRIAIKKIQSYRGVHPGDLQEGERPGASQEGKRP